MATTYAIPDGRVAMAATLWTGTGAAQTVSNAVNGVSFQPDFVWAKSRSSAESHRLEDSVRGATLALYSNLTNAEATEAQSITAFGASGFTLGTGTPNTSAVTYVGWQWKAGGTAVSNTAGSITSSVSANPTAGFSVVTWTGSASASSQTVGHGLGVIPSMVILKNRSVVDNWFVYHSSATANNQYLNLNTTSAVTTAGSNTWGAGMTSTLVGLRPGTFCGSSSDNVVMYCFAPVAGYSAFGSYTGNGSADGPFVYLGFRPRFVMFKNATGAGNSWVIFDTSRTPSNQDFLELKPESAGAESPAGSYAYFDFLSNGFKVRTTSTAENASGQTIIYMAFAENPFKYANAR